MAVPCLCWDRASTWLWRCCTGSRANTHGRSTLLPRRCCGHLMRYHISLVQGVGLAIGKKTSRSLFQVEMGEDEDLSLRPRYNQEEMTCGCSAGVRFCLHRSCLPKALVNSALGCIWWKNLAHHTNPKSCEGGLVGTLGLGKPSWQAPEGRVSNRKPAGGKHRQCQL